MQFGPDDAVGRFTPANNLAPGIKTQSGSSAKDSERAADDAHNKETSTIDEIRHMGFRAYVEETQKRHMEELREKILMSMGLSEEELKEMPAEQRNLIEDVISAEIKKRMMANSIANSSNETDAARVSLKQMPTQVAADAMDSGQGQGMEMGLALIEAIEQANTPEHLSRNKSEDKDG